MANLPSKIELNNHSRQRLEERNKIHNYYNTKNLMKSSVKWYSKDDLIPDCALYRHSCYTTRKSNQMAYITDGNIEVIYNKNTKVAITILEVKEKFIPITQYIKPNILNHIKAKKENKKMGNNIGECPDCGETDVEIVTVGKYAGVCEVCRRRKQNARARGIDYIPYKNLSKGEKEKIQILRKSHAKKENLKDIKIETPKIIPIVENYYQVKAENNPAIAHVIEKPIDSQDNDSHHLSDSQSFITILKECGCEIPDENLKDVLNILVNTDKLKDIFMTIAKSNNQQAMLDLEQALNVVERKLQHNWEYNGFQEADDIKFKGFLTWRRTIKGAIFFWKKLYQTNTIIEMQRAWNSYTQDPNEKIVMAGERMESSMKRFQITTESISTIFNTRRPFTRVFYATDKEHAYEMFKQWMADRQLHENKSKTTIVELTNEGIDARKEVD